MSSETDGGRLGTEAAKSPTSAPSLRFDPEEVRAGAASAATTATALELFRANGCLLLHGVLPAEQVTRLRESYGSRYERFFRDRAHRDALRVGKKRFMVTVALTPPFSDPVLYANPLVMPVLEGLLGPRFVLGSFGSVVSLPGAPDQHVHRDLAPLFPDSGTDTLLPSFAITVIVPLVEMNETNGTTRLWKGTHVQSDEDAAAMPSQDPHVPLGSFLLMDYRLRHGGTANRSANVRPILYNVYQRRWFRDWANYGRQPALRISRSELNGVPEAHRHLFSAARHRRFSRWATAS